MKRFIIYAGRFVLGGLATLVPMYIQASIIHSQETARHEQTMAPGITMFFGAILAPLGGLLGVVIAVVISWMRENPTKL